MASSAESAASSRPAAESSTLVPESTSGHPSSTDNTVDKAPDAEQKAGVTNEASATGISEGQKSPQQQSFAAAVFPGFNPPKISTPAFFSSMQGKIQSTLANAKTPTINKVDIKQIQTSTEHLANSTKDWGVNAFKTLSSAAQRVGANVTQGIQKEHEEFIKQKKLETVVPHQGTEALPAWAGLPDEEKIKARILSLSKDKRNFVLPPPPGTDFVFDMNVYSSTAIATLKQDSNLEKMRFSLVPREVEELVFWRNYFYRVSLLKQVALAGVSGASADGSAEAGGFAAGESSSSSGKSGHSRPLSESSVLGYNIYFGEDDVDVSPRRSRSSSTIAKDSSASSPTSPSATKNKSEAKPETKSEAKPEAKPEAKKKEEKSEVLFEAEMPDQDEDPDAWLEKQLASGVSIGDDGADVDVGDWEKELQNELKDYDG